MTDGYIDLQVNGYGGVDFNSDDLTIGGLYAACKLLREHGVAQILATIITEDLPLMCRRIARVVEFRQLDPVCREVIAGIHVEGPFLNETPGYRGAHPVDAIRPAELEAAKRLVDAGGGLVRLVTLAPERDAGLAVTKFLVGRGIVVSAGHCDPSLDQLVAACDAGLSMFTHLGNGCPPQLPRHDNIIQRALSLSDRLTLGFIADGVHVPLFALKNHLRAAGVARCVVVTDAIAAAGLGPGRYRLSRWEVSVGPDCAARSPDGSHLVGSAVTMPRNADNLSRGVGLCAADVRLLLRDNALRLLDRAGG